MVHSAEERLLLVARLKAEVLALLREKKISQAEYRRLSEGLDELNFDLTRALPARPMKELLAEVNRLGLAVETAAFKVRLQEGRLEALLARREAALTEGLGYLDISEFFEGITRIPLSPFQWESVTEAYRQLVRLLDEPETSFVAATAACQAFFEHEKGIGLPPGFAPPTPALMNELVNLGLVEKQDRETLVSDINTVTQARHEARARLSHDFFAGGIAREDFYAAGDPAYQLLRDQVFSTGKEVSPALDGLIVQWPGLNRAGLLAQWLKMSARNREKDELVTACTGIDPSKQLKAWQRWVQADQEREKAGYALFRRATSRRKPLYDLAYMLGCHHRLADSAEQLWWPMMQQFIVASAESAQETPPPLILVPEPETAPAQTLPPPLPTSPSTPAPPAAQPPPPEPEPVAPTPSAWEAYLKPFLVENWAWLVGFSLVMMGLLFFSMVFWQESRVFRLLAGPVPLLLFTLICGLMAHFIHSRQREATLNAGRLFAALCLLSLALNYAIGASILLANPEEGRTLSLVTGLGLALAYSMLTPFLARRLAGILGANLSTVLLATNSILYLPSLALLTGLAHYPYGLLQAVPFLSLLATVVLGLCRLSGETRVQRRLTAVLLCGNAFVGTGLLFVFFRILPAPATLAVLLQLIALSAAYLYGSRAVVAVLAGGASVLGHLVALGDPNLLPVSLALGALFWIRQRRHLKANWPGELIALHMVLIALALLLPITDLLAISMNPGLVPLALAVGLSGCLLWEWRHTRRELRLISWALPLLALSSPFLTDLAGGWFGRSLAMGLLLLCCGYAYWRYLRWFRQTFWLLQNALLLLLPIFCLELNAEEGLFAVGVYLNLASFAWIAFTLRPNDALARQHRCLLLWLVAFLAVGVHGYGVIFEGISLALLVSSALALVPLLVAAKWSRSALPTFVALAFVWTTVALARAHYGFAGRSGLGTALFAGACLVAAHLLARYRVCQGEDGHDRFFNRNYLFYSQRFLIKPCQVAAWVLTLISLAKAFLYFETAGSDFRIALALALDTYLVARAALHFRSRLLGLLVLVPVAGLFVALVGSVPGPWRAHAAWLLLAGLFAGRGLLAQSGEVVAQVLGKPLGIVQLLVAVVSLPVGMFVYVSIWQAPVIDVISFTVLAILFIHFFLVSRHHRIFNNIVILHGLVLFANLYLGPAPWAAFEGDFWTTALALLGGWVLIAALPSWWWEMARGEDGHGYVKAASIWAAGLALVYAVLALAGFWDEGIVFTHAVLAYGLVYLAFRRWRFWLPVLVRGFTGLMGGTLLIEGDLLGLFAGLLMFAAAEALLLQMGRFPQLKFQPTPSDRGYRNLAIVLQPLIFILLFTHLSGYWFGSGETLPTGDFLVQRMLPLYGLVPLCMFAAYKLGYAYLGMGRLVLLAYANIFLSLGFMPMWRGLDLTPLHAMSVACVASIFLFLVLGRLFATREASS